MLFDEITNDGRLWSVRYEGEEENALLDRLPSGMM